MSAPTTVPDADDITQKSKVGSVVEQLLAPPAQQVEYLELSRLCASPDNPPERMTADLEDLAASIDSMGILEPLIVASAPAWQAADDRMPFLRTDADYVVLAGHRRLAAARTVNGFDLAPCIVRDDLVGADADVAMAVENGQRKDLTPIQEATAFQRLSEVHGRSQREIAKLVGRDQAYVSRRLSLLALPDNLQGKVGTPELSIDDATAIAKFADDPKAVTKILKRPSWQTISQAGQAAADERRRAEQLAAATKKLKAQGVRIVKLGMYGVPDGSVKLAELAERGLDVDEHIHFECHAVALGFKKYSSDNTLQQIPVCTNPKVHPESIEAARSSSRGAQDRKEERERQAREKRHTDRLAAIKAATTKPAGDTEQLVLTITLCDLLSESFDEEEHTALLGILGLTVDLPEADDATKGSYSYSRDAELAWSAAVLEFAAKSTANLKRATAAAVLIRAESTAEHVWTPNRAAAAFLEWLPKHGHKLAAGETKSLKAAKGETS